MPFKTCRSCKKSKPVSSFAKRHDKKDGLQLICRKCSSANHKAYLRTKEGIVSNIYGSQRSSSKKRGDSMPPYSNLELRAWIFNQPNFGKIYNAWVNSGYVKDKVPSTDRLDDYKPYSLDNIRLTTWEDNNRKGYADRRNGTNNKNSRSVIQFSMDGVLISEHYSIRSAARKAGVNRGNVGSCCRGAKNYSHAGGYLWKFKESVHK